MSNLYKKYVNSNFTKVANELIRDDNLSSDAKVIYIFLMGLPRNTSITDRYICKSTGLKIKNVTNKKRELKEAGLLFVDRVGTKAYNTYLGSYSMCAELFMLEVKRNNERNT